jgi:hypothetical protein
MGHGSFTGSLLTTILVSLPFFTLNRAFIVFIKFRITYPNTVFVTPFRFYWKKPVFQAYLLYVISQMLSKRTAALSWKITHTKVRTTLLHVHSWRVRMRMVLISKNLLFITFLAAMLNSQRNSAPVEVKYWVAPVNCLLTMRVLWICTMCYIVIYC